MQLDFFTTFIITGIIIAAISLSILVFSFTRRENLLFLWATVSGLMFAAAYILGSFRGLIPEFFSILIFNLLIILALMAYCELYSRLLSILPRWRFLLFLLPVFFTAAFHHYIYINPSYQARVLIFNLVVLILTVYIVSLLIVGAKRTRLYIHLLAALPFIFMVLITLLKLLLRRTGREFSFTSSLDFVLNFLMMLSSVWAALSAILLIGNRLQYQIEQVARTDPLTSALNRRVMQEVLMKELGSSNRNGRTLSIILCDIDRFKQVNDTYGHLVGDSVLIESVNIFRSCLRPTDLLARYGGEEFLIVLPETDDAEALATADRMREKIAEARFEHEGKRVSLTASFGVTSHDHESLIQRADTALYEAKHQGRNKAVCISPH